MAHEIPDEEWKVINGFKIYEVSNFGNVRTCKTKFQLSININPGGYCIVGLWTDNEIRKTVQVHRLVALAFVDNPENKPCVTHINHDRADNRIHNLK